MTTWLRNILALVAGIVLGSAVNMALITLSPSIIAPPPGVDVKNAASLAASMHLFEPRQFVMPFLAHALGTLAGAFVTGLIAATHKTALAYTIGVVFLAGGIAASFMLPAPKWFIALDLLLAYIPMAWLGLKWSARGRPQP